MKRKKKCSNELDSSLMIVKASLSIHFQIEFVAHNVNSICNYKRERRQSKEDEKKMSILCVVANCLSVDITVWWFAWLFQLKETEIRFDSSIHMLSDMRYSFRDQMKTIKNEHQTNVNHISMLIVCDPCDKRQIAFHASANISSWRLEINPIGK